MDNAEVERPPLTEAALGLLVLPEAAIREAGVEAEANVYRRWFSCPTPLWLRRSAHRTSRSRIGRPMANVRIQGIAVDGDIKLAKPRLSPGYGQVDGFEAELRLLGIRSTRRRRQHATPYTEQVVDHAMQDPFDSHRGCLETGCRALACAPRRRGAGRARRNVDTAATDAEPRDSFRQVAARAAGRRRGCVPAGRSLQSATPRSGRAGCERNVPVSGSARMRSRLSSPGR